MRVVDFESKQVHPGDLLIDHVTSRQLALIYFFYCSLQGIFLVAGYLSPPAIARDENIINTAYYDAANSVKCHLTIQNLRREHRFVFLSIRAVRQDVQDHQPLNLRYEHTINMVSDGGRTTIVDARPVKLSLAFDEGRRHDHETSVEAILSRESILSDSESWEYEFSFCLDRSDITQLRFTFSYADPTAVSYRQLMKCSLSVGLFVSLVFVGIHVGDSDNPVQIFYCFVLGIAGILGSAPLDFWFKDQKSFRCFELLFEEVYVLVYRTFTVIQACYVALGTIDLRIRYFVGIMVMCGIYAAIEVTYLTTQTERKIGLFHSRMGDPVILGDLRKMLVFVAYSIVVFLVLIVSLARMKDRHWNRGGILVAVLLVPMVFEVIYEVQFPLFGLLRFSSLQSISRMSCYGLGGILFVLTFNPIIDKVGTD
jgi:hypothetical protein